MGFVFIFLLFLFSTWKEIGRTSAKNSWRIPRIARTKTWGFLVESEKMGGTVQEEWIIQNTVGFNNDCTANHSVTNQEAEKEEMRNHNSNGRIGPSMECKE